MSRTSGQIDTFPARVHLLGVGGGGVSGVARILRARGHRVSGSDREAGAVIESLREIGIPIGLDRGDSLDPLPEEVELVVRSAAVPADDPRVLEAAARGVPSIKYAQALARLCPPRRTLAVAGTHGKTTTAWMVAHALLGLDAAAAPGALIGGVCRRLEVGALPGEPGGWFAVEACEYDRTFLNLAPYGAIVTNVEADHLDYYGSPEAIEQAFARFVDRVAPDGLVVLGREAPESLEAATRARCWRLGRELHVDLRGETRGRFRFRLRGPGWASPEVDLAVPGEFNVENAALALALVVGLAAPGSAGGAARAAAGLSRFGGVERRFETWGEVGGTTVVHDYAHHPTEVRVTLEAARRALPGRPLHVLFQPHQHSRTARFLEGFAESLRFADRVVVADVYGARAHIDGARRAGSPELVQALERRSVEAEHGGALPRSLSRFVAGLPASCAALVLGAGDVEGIRHELLHDLALRGALRSAPRR